MDISEGEGERRRAGAQVCWGAQRLKIWWPGLKWGLIYPARIIPSSSDVSNEAPWKPPMAPERFLSTTAITWEGSKNPVKPCLVSGALVSLKADQYARGRPWGHTWVMLECFRTPEWNLYVLYCYTSALNTSSWVGWRLNIESYSSSYARECFWQEGVSGCWFCIHTRRRFMATLTRGGSCIKFQWLKYWSRPGWHYVMC